MIHISYDADDLRVKIDGHAYSGEPGNDLVCSAVTILTHTLVRNCELADKGGVIHEFHHVLKDGGADISAVPDDGYQALVANLFDSFCVGYEMLFDRFPEYIQFEAK